MVAAAEWAMEAEPMPASLEKAARRKPVTSTPIIPPRPAWGVNASAMIIPRAAGTLSALATSTTMPAIRYTMHMIGTMKLATVPMRLMPPMITTPTRAAISRP